VAAYSILLSPPEYAEGYEQQKYHVKARRLKKHEMPRQRMRVSSTSSHPLCNHAGSPNWDIDTRHLRLRVVIICKYSHDLHASARIMHPNIIKPKRKQKAMNADLVVQWVWIVIAFSSNAVDRP